jgi:hypothetical protein
MRHCAVRYAVRSTITSMRLGWCVCIHRSGCCNLCSPGCALVRCASRIWAPWPCRFVINGRGPGLSPSTRCHACHQYPDARAITVCYGFARIAPAACSVIALFVIHCVFLTVGRWPAYYLSVHLVLRALLCTMYQTAVTTAPLATS